MAGTARPMDASSAEIQVGVNSLLDSYATVNEQDFCLVVYTPECRKHAAHMQVNLTARKISHSIVSMRPFHDPELGRVLEEHLPPRLTSTGKLIVFTLERESLSNSAVFAGLPTRYGKSRVKLFRTISASDELFAYGFSTPPSELSRRNATLLDLLSNEQRIRVTSPSGTDLEVDLDHDTYDWISNRGVWRPGVFAILPAGEIASYSPNINGRLVADGAIHLNVVTNVDLRLAQHPAAITIENSVAVASTCGDPDLDDLITRCFERPNVRRTGEIGFGTNAGCTTFAAYNSHLNERFPGFHIGFGAANQPESKVSYSALIHMDLITNDATLHLPRARRDITLSSFTPRPEIRHPALLRDQDVAGDCCSRGCMPLMPGILQV